MYKIATTQVWVHDQDEALAFYTEKLGMRVRADLTLPELGSFRWLTVSPAGQPEVTIVLMAIPGEPVFDAETGEQIRALLGKGAVSAIFLTATDINAEYEELKARGVPFDAPPTEQPWGIDTSFRDPSGNNFRLAQLAEVPAGV
jgi:catechol 2,3-dioxygenase-like lactoylglutathione lyase family enzyme